MNTETELMTLRAAVIELEQQVRSLGIVLRAVTNLNGRAEATSDHKTSMVNAAWSEVLELTR